MTRETVQNPAHLDIAAAPRIWSATTGKLFWVTAQLVGLLFVMREFNLFDEGVIQVFEFMVVGFVIHALLPLQYRMPFFLALSLGSVFYVLGARDGIWLVALSLALICICHLPFSFTVRAGLLIAAGLVLAGFRGEWGLYPSIERLLPDAMVGEHSVLPWSEAVWPLLGSMLMFRLIIYLYDIEHDRERPQLTRTLSYFFMLPNVCFPLFPVVDYKRFGRSHYNEDACLIYQRGIAWILRGVIHLILYRFVYYYLVVDPLEVNGLGSMLQYSLAAFLLYLQVSGQFHLIVGVLLLFGFNLPETHHLFYLASSFTDFWRRINIYWKDFVMKVVYYPVHFRLKRFGPSTAMVCATLVVFLATWFLHAYQWFWLRGELLLAWHDALFWTVLGALVVIDSIRETRHGRARAIARREWTPAGLAAVACRTFATFWSICLLWGMWSADSIGQWFAMWRTTGWTWLPVVAVIPAAALAAVFFERLDKARPVPSRRPAALPVAEQRFVRLVTPTALSIAIVYLLGQAPVYSLAPERVASAFDRVRFAHLNELDLARQERGYYEDLIGVNRQNVALLAVYSKRPEDWRENAVLRETPDDFVEKEPIPNLDVIFKGAAAKTNAWGMRDRPYEQTKPPQTFRIAVMGASHVFGSGVRNDETFESLVEERFNSDRPSTHYRHYELLNFGVGGRTALEQAVVLERSVAAFQPDVVLLVAHPRDSRRAADFLARQLRAGVPIPHDYIRRILDEAGIEPGMSRFALMQRLLPTGEALLRGAYDQIVAFCRARDIAPILMMLPMTYEPTDRAIIERELQIARDAGFTVISLLDVYKGHDPKSLMIAPWDDHPNAAGHRLVADRLQQALREHWQKLTVARSDHPPP